MLRNDFPYFEATFALGHVGARAVPINWHYTGEETGHILRNAGAKKLVWADMKLLMKEMGIQR